MSQLADWQIREQLKIQEVNGFKLISPFDEAHLQPASYDVHLGTEVRSETGMAYQISDSGEDMEPGRFILAHTEESFEIPPHLVARIEGKSTLARHGLQIHSAGFVDPGFRGQLTLELKHLGQLRHIILRRGMLIGQISFYALAGRPERLYGDAAVGSHYQGQVGATPAARLR